MADRLKEVLAGVLEVTTSELSDDASSDNLPGWDSLRQLEVILALELEYGIRISTADVFELQDLPSIREYLTRHGKA